VAAAMDRGGGVSLAEGADRGGPSTAASGLHGTLPGIMMCGATWQDVPPPPYPSPHMGPSTTSPLPLGR
jgi:hypothetical protein